MSIRLMTWVWEHSPYKGATLLLHLALADHANDQGTCWPSQKRLAIKARCSERAIRGMIKQMMADGHLELERHSNGRKTNLYRLITPEIFATGSTLPPHTGSFPPKNHH